MGTDKGKRKEERIKREKWRRRERGKRNKGKWMGIEKEELSTRKNREREQNGGKGG